MTHLPQFNIFKNNWEFPCQIQLFCWILNVTNEKWERKKEKYEQKEKNQRKKEIRKMEIRFCRKLQNHFGRGVTLRTRGHDMGWWSFPLREKSPFPSAHLLQLGQWKSHQGCKSRTMELFALHRQWMIVWLPGHTVALLHWLVLLGSN